MKKVKYLVIAGYVMILVGSLSSISCLTSSAKYTKEDLHALNYGVKFKDLSSSYTKSTVLDTSDAYTLKYGLSFKRANNMEADDTSETFQVQIDNPYCQIESVSINKVVTPITNSKITFMSLGEDQVDMTIHCDLQSMVDNHNLKIKMDTYGSFNGIEDMNYLFATDTFQITDINAYYDQFGWPDRDSCIPGNKTCRLLKSNDEADMYTRLLEWIGKTTKIAETNTGVIHSYLSSSVLNFDNKVNEQNITYFNTLDGIKAWPDEKYYIFEVDDSFGSHAATDTAYRTRDSETSSFNFYFYQEGDAEFDFDDLFLKYIKKYASSADTKVVSDYLKKKEEEYHVDNVLGLITVTPRLAVMTYYPDEKRLQLPANFYSILSGEKVTNPLSKEVDLKTRVRSLRNYLDDYVGPTFRNQILYQSDGTYTYIVNCAGKDDTIFDHYTYVENGTEGLVIHVYATSSNTTQVMFATQYMNGNTLDFTYDFSATTSNTNANIKADLNSISQNLKGADIQILDQGGNPISNLDNTLFDGEYQSTIGTIKVETKNNQKKVTITLAK